MAILKKKSAASYHPMPRKNGRGITREILRFPENSDNFDFRLSIAEVSQPGDFSFFNGYHRVLSILNGEGISLLIENERTKTLKKQEIFNFSGDLSIYSNLLDGPVTDFNLIYNPEKFDIRFQWLETGKNSNTILTSALHTFIFSNKNLCKVIVNKIEKELNPEDTLWITKEENDRGNDISITATEEVIIAELWEKA